MQFLVWLIACHQNDPADSTLSFPGREDDTSTTPTDDTASTLPTECPSGIVYSDDDAGTATCLAFAEDSFAVDEQILSSVAFDYDHDGDQDLYLGLYNADHDILLKNTGSGFVDVSDSVGLTAGGNTWAVLSADFNNDGYADLAITGDDGTQILQNNSGSGVTAVADLGVSLGTALVLVDDFLFVGSANGLKVFEHASGFSFGSNEASTRGVQDSGQASGFAVLDADGDGDVDDVFVANATGGNRLFVQTSSGTFASQEDAYGVAGDASKNAMGAIRLDFQNTFSDSLYVYYADGSAELFVHDGLGFTNEASGWQVNAVSPACGAQYFKLTPTATESLVIGRCEDDQTLLVEHPVIEDDAIVRYSNVAEALNINVAGMVRNIHQFDVNGDDRADVVVPLYEGGVAVFYDQSFAVQY